MNVMSSDKLLQQMPSEVFNPHLQVIEEHRRSSTSEAAHLGYPDSFLRPQVSITQHQISACSDAESVKIKEFIRSQIGNL